MKQKLLDIKLILRIIISVLIIFSMLKSCAKAVQNVEQSLIDEINANIVRVANYYNITYYPIYGQNETISRDSSILYCIYITESDSGWLPNTIGAFFPQYDTLSPTYNGSQVLNQIRTGVRNINNNQSTGVGDWSLKKSTKFKYLYTKCSWASTTGFNYVAGEEYGATILLKPPNPLSFGNMFSEDYTYNGDTAQAILTNYVYTITFIDNLLGYESGENINLQLYDLMNNITINTLEFQDLGDYGTIKVDTRLINFNTPYNLYVSQGEYELEETIFFFPTGTIITSGAITSYPSGDFSYNIQNSTNDIINNQQQEQEENKNFFENLYTNMFTMNSGEVSGEVNRLINSLNLTDSGEREIIGMIYDEFNREPSDFVISWGAKNITIDGQTIPLIPSGEINFSEKCREEPSLARVKGLINVMVSASLLMAFIIGNHDMILRLLGTENTFLDDDRVEYVVTAEQVAQEALPPPNYPTWSGTDPNYWWYRARKR